MTGRQFGTGLLLALTATWAAGCVHGAASRGPGAPVVVMPATVIESDPTLLGLNDEELFARGSSAFAAGDFLKAVRCFERLEEAFPNSRYRRQALYNAGLSHERLKQWEDAATRFAELADPAHGTGDALDASFRQAEALYQLGRYADALTLLNALAARTDLALNARLEAQVQQGICQLEAGQPAAAEGTLRQALDAYDADPQKDALDDYFPAQAEFFLGELYRLKFQAVRLDGRVPADQLGADLELKAELLLSAQGHYLRSIRMGNTYWATAAGSQIGELYKTLYDDMTHAALPSDLSDEEAAAYCEELHKRIRVLLSKAIASYETTLEAAERTATASPFLEKTRENLKRMKEQFLAEVGVSSPTDPKASPDAGSGHPPRTD